MFLGLIRLLQSLAGLWLLCFVFLALAGAVVFSHDQGDRKSGKVLIAEKLPANGDKAAVPRGLSRVDGAVSSALSRPEQQERSTVSCELEDETARPLDPSSCLRIGDDLYLLGVDRLWFSREGYLKLNQGVPLACAQSSPPVNGLQGVPTQEFLAAVYYPAHHSIVILDKSGSLFEFDIRKTDWRLFRANVRTLGSPDPHYVSLDVCGDHLCLLDPERNQIWRFPCPPSKQRYFRDVLPWRIKPGDPNVSDAIAIVVDGPSAYVLRRGGSITRYPTNAHGGNGNPQSIRWKLLPGMRPTRLANSGGRYLYIVERENNRVLAVAKTGGGAKQFLFPGNADLRGVLPGKEGFWVVDGSRLVYRSLLEPDKDGVAPAPRRIDSRLEGIAMPVRGAGLPRHPGVFPGARRLYRHGVHQGLDFFHDPGCGTYVEMDTPAVAAEAGKVIRADVDYRDMNDREYARVMTDCAKKQFCSEANEDLFRGCQVWLDHGNGLITRYAHLDKARSDLKPGMKVRRGETVGYIGVSGTGENTSGRFKHPHLHFEIWLDGHYLGYGLSLAETVGVYEDIFGHAHRKTLKKERLRS